MVGYDGQKRSMTDRNGQKGYLYQRLIYLIATQGFIYNNI